MSLSALMPRMNPGLESSSLRSQETALAMNGPTSPAAPAGPAAAAAAPAGAPPEGSAAGAQAAAAGAEGVQPSAPPSTGKTVFGSVLRGAMTGASLGWSVNRFFPAALLKVVHFIPPLRNVAAIGTVAALVGGAVVGGVLGLVAGLKKARKQQAAYASQVAAQQAAAQQQAQAQAPPVGDPLVLGPDGKPVAIDPATNVPIPPGQPAPDAVAGANARPRRKVRRNPEMGSAGAKAGSSSSGKACSCPGCCGDSGGRKIRIRRGDTLGALARRHGTSVSALMRANPKIDNPNLIYAGDTLVVPRRRRS